MIDLLDGNLSIQGPGTKPWQVHDKDATGTLWSVKGDINALATTIRRWIESNGRTASPKFIAGESYGGFRVPLITHELQTDQGIGVNGQILISPVLDFASRRFGGAMSHVALLPSLVATAKSAKAPEGKITRADLTSTEDYARSEFLTDLVKGRSNLDAVSRLADKVSKLTGLERSLVAQRAGRIPMNVFIREFYRSSGRIASVYDARVSGLDPDRHSARNKSEDQLRLGLHAPIIQAMSGLYRDKLKWIYPDGRYMFQSKSAGSSWKWGRRPPESVSELASTLALDPEMRVLITHGLTDLVTPYFATQLTLDDMPKISGKQRVKFQVYPGGHMFYSQEASRKAFRDDARKMIKAAAER